MANKTDHPLERLVFFSDAVFAIAITLLVIELHAPHLPRGASNEAHWQALADLIPNFIGYLISFLIIGAFWMGHHRVFMYAAHYHSRILKWNMGLLLTIAFMPFVTNYYSTNLGGPVPTTLYCVEMFIASLFNLMVNRTATSRPMVDENASAETIAYIRQRGVVMVLGTGMSIVTAILYPEFGQIGLLSIPLWRVLLKKWTGVGRPEGL